MEFKVCVGVCCWEVKNSNPGYFNLPDTISFLSILWACLKNWKKYFLLAKLAIAGINQAVLSNF